MNQTWRSVNTLEYRIVCAADGVWRWRTDLVIEHYADALYQFGAATQSCPCAQFSHYIERREIGQWERGKQ